MPGKVAKRQIKFRGIKFYPHEECVGIGVAMFVGVQNIAAVLSDESGNSSDDAFAVGTGEKEDGGILHGTSRVIKSSDLQSFSLFSSLSRETSSSAPIHTQTFTIEVVLVGYC